MYRRPQGLTNDRLVARAGSLLVIAALAFGACGEQRDPIDRTETLALPKAMFSGEWYYQQTVIKVPASKTVSMEGNTNYNGMHRVRWEIQEDYIYARKAYEFIEGAEHVDEDSGEFRGAIVGAWRVESQFDIKRSYNPTTGEENNVVEENAADCKWNECKYLRVDWSQNLATDFMFLDSNDAVEKEGVSFNNEDKNDPAFRPIFDEQGGYIDFVTAMALHPQQKYFPSIQRSYPVCWLFSNSDCNTEILYVRNSFMRRHPNRDYEPREHKGAITEWFGFFDNSRLTWNDKINLVQTEQKKMINRHNIWARHHFDDIACTTNKECTDVHGAASRCDKYIGFHTNDVWTDTDVDGLPDSFETAWNGGKLNKDSTDSDGDGVLDQNDDADGNGKADLYDYYVWASQNKVHRCTIPLAEREPRPIAYFDSGSMPRDLSCDKDDGTEGPCAQVWRFSADKKVREATWSVQHKISNDYDETFWRVFLRGAYGWSQANFDKWIATRDIKQFAPGSKEYQDLQQFGCDEVECHAYVICPNNPVLDSDPWPCRFNHKTWSEAKQLIADGKDNAAMRPVVRQGDIRFSQTHYAKDYYDGWRLLGLGPSHTDPRTGENVSGVANVYILNDWAATRIQEMVQMLRGDLDPKDFVDGKNIDFWTGRLNDKNAKGAKQRQVNMGQIKAMYDSMQQPWMKKVKKLGSPKAFADMHYMGKPVNQTQLKKILIGETAKSGLFDMGKFQGGLHMLKGTSLERMMVNDPDVLMGSGINPQLYYQQAGSAQLPDSVLDQASLARGGFVDLAKARSEWRMTMAERMNAYSIEMADNAMVGLAHRLKDLPPEQVWAKAREIIMQAVLTHELGHTVGLHHNWGGSEDALNYPEEYWRLRTSDFTQTKLCNAQNPAADQLCPFFIKPFTDYQLGRDAKNAAQGLKGIYEYSYTSIMDYSGRYTLDGDGLARYDKAALMYGHADKVEVFEDTHGVPDGVNNGSFNLFDRWHRDDGSPLALFSVGPQGYHYTNWFATMGKDLFQESNRKLVDYREVKDYCKSDQGNEIKPCDELDPNASSSAGAFYLDGDKFKPRVPYVFCSYTRTNISDGCRTRDYGADQWERMNMFIDDMNSWYPLRSFTRYAVGASQEGYISAWWDRYYEIKDFNNSYGLYQGLFHQWYDDAQISNFFTDPVNGWGAYTVAMNDAFNFALRTLAMPDVKPFKPKAAEPDGQVIYSEAVFSEAFSTNINNGRYFTTSWSDTNYNDQCGLNFWECLHHYGFYYDKILTLFALTDPVTYFVARDTAEDVRTWRISFFDNYQTQLVDFFGSVLAEDYDAHAPWFDPGKDPTKTIMETMTQGGKQFDVEWINGIAYRNYATPALDPPKPANGGAVEPATRFTLQLYLALFGVLMFQGNFDMDFVERSLMWREGPGQGYNVSSTDKVSGTASFLDPFTGTRYVALNYNDKRGVAQRMIAHANVLKSRTSYCTAGNPAAADACTTLDARAENALYEYRQLMDVMLKLTSVYREGSNWSWNPFDPG